ncbi:MAG: bifunctional ADP-heptose synthase [Armatimonadota bacterium]|nr:bifunctional ADP-heptose synthase [Armatimonadota bacterium]MCX7777376.1 bifunctional ADP-heptose synthase [Armatimonadota bacterium]MDW8025356.1 bifunctional ADP-heptose synthase [Armatimonadota bacterium]
MDVPMLTLDEVEPLLKRFQSLSVLVVGDLMLDEYIIGDAERLSPEAPVPVLLRRERKVGPGGAANVVCNLRSLGAQVFAAGVIGDDTAGDELICLLESIGADVSAIVTETFRPTTLKTRVIAHKQQLVRIDYEVRTPISDMTCDAIIERIMPLLPKVNALIVSDYAKGVVRERLLEALKKAPARNTILLCGGPKPRNIASFIGFDLLSFNTAEAIESAMLNGEPANDYKQVGSLLASSLNVKWLVITRGEEGASLFDGNGWLCDIPSYRVTVYDVAGAGDTYLAAIALALACGADFVTAAKLANAAAAAAVRKVGVAPVTADEIRQVVGGRLI